MIGFYDYTVILTYLGALVGMQSMVLALHGQYMGSIYCLAAALVCDTLDGKVARAKKNRTKGEMLFGIQIDSLCDVISFGLAPAVMFYALGLQSWMDQLLLGAYVLCCVIRLGYFNTLAVQAELGTKGDYHGLPVVCLTIMVPALYLTGIWLPENLFLWVLRLGTAVFGLLYIVDFPVKKPCLWKYVVMVAVFWVPVGLLLLLG